MTEPRKGCAGVVKDRLGEGPRCPHGENCRRFVWWPGPDTPFNLCWASEGFPNYEPKAGAPALLQPVPATPDRPQLDLFA